MKVVLLKNGMVDNIIAVPQNQTAVLVEDTVLVKRFDLYDDQAQTFSTNPQESQLKLFSVIKNQSLKSLNDAGSLDDFKAAVVQLKNTLVP